MASVDNAPSSQSTGSPALKEQVIIISSDHDLTITVKGRKNKAGQRFSTKFKVKREALTSKSEYFKNSLRFNRANDHGDPVLEDDNSGAMLLWFRYMHDLDEERYWKLNNIRKVELATIWHVINAGDKYLFEGEWVKAVQDFFVKWYKANVDMAKLTPGYASALALPCFFFDYAEGFAAVTKWLAYNNEGHVKEERPVHFKFTHLHLCPPDFVGPVNHARGSLKTCLHKGIWNDIGTLIKSRSSRCRCGKWDVTAGRYLAALVDTGAYPFEITFPKSSINTILQDLGDFTMEEADSVRYCPLCSKNWDAKVNEAVAFTQRDFDGLCLDCMDKTRFKRENPD